MALPAMVGEVAPVPGNGLNVPTKLAEAQPSLGAPVGTTQKIGKMPVQRDEAALPTMTSLDPTVTATVGEVAPALGNGLNVPTAPVVTTQKIAKTPVQNDEAVLPAMTSLDPVVTAIGEDGQSMTKDDQPETSAQAQPAAQIASQIDPSAASTQASQAVAAQMVVMLTPANPRASAAPTTARLPTEPGQPLATITTSLPVQVATASGDKPKADVKNQRNAFTLAAETIGAGASEAATTAADGAQGTPTDSPRSRTSDAAPIATAATSMISPLRAIVDSLPPVIQSSLAAAPVSAVTGPSTGEMLGDQVIDMGVSGQWIDRMAREITTLSEGSGHSRFTLNPPHLGRLEVNLWQGQDGTSLRLTAETDEAARRLSEGRPALQADARMAALNLGTITIEKAAPSHEAGRDQAQRQGGDQASQMQQQSGNQGQGPGNNQTRAGNGQQQGEWVNRFVRDEPAQPSDAAALTPAQRAARGNVRFA
jgi:hypothetical protein